MRSSSPVNVLRLCVLHKKYQAVGSLLLVRHTGLQLYAVYSRTVLLWVELSCSLLRYVIPALAALLLLLAVQNGSSCCYPNPLILRNDRTSDAVLLGHLLLI